MSFAVIQTGGKQYKVSASEILKIERLNNEEGKTVEFKNVLFLNDDKTTEIGNPNIQGAKVEATILKNIKNIRHISIAPLMGEAIKRINSDSSVSALFE